MNRNALLLLFTSWLIVALGQPAWIWWLGPLSASIGFALMWQVALKIPSPLYRFGLGTAWFAAVQLIQFSWALSHPFAYIYIAYGLACLAYGMQFGLLCLVLTPERLARPLFPFQMAAIWTLLEWSRLFILSGSSWNPVGLALTGSTFSLQTVSLYGVYGLSFLVIAVNAYCLKLFQRPSSLYAKTFFALILAFPYLFGALHLAYHQRADKEGQTLSALLVQPSFPVEEWLAPFSLKEGAEVALGEWEQIIQLLKPHSHEHHHLILLPENSVLFPAYAPVYSYEQVAGLFEKTLGGDHFLPELETGAALAVDTPKGKLWMVTNAYIAQAIANWMQTSFIVGLEDREADPSGAAIISSSALHFAADNLQQEKYNKRVLVPFGEYVPFAIFANYVKEYGITGSFTPGTAARVINCQNIKVGFSICYEETFGHLMRDNRLEGADVLLNLTNDGWYPESRLPYQHFEHARPRTVEMGIPLLRACNTGFTCAVDSLGRTVASLNTLDQAGILKVSVPLYHYQTLYARFGDWPMLLLSLFFVCSGLLFRKP